MRVVNFIGVTGERQAILIDESGLPDFWTAKWVLEKVRKSGLAANTISTKLHAIHCLYRAVPATADLTPRLARCEWVSVAEADHLLEQMAYPTQQIEPFGGRAIQSSKKSSRSKVIGLEKARSKLKVGKANTVKTNTKFLRLLFAREYLTWRANEQIVLLRGEKKAALANAVNEIDLYIEERIAKFRNASSLGTPKGLTQAQQQVLLDVIRHDSPRNPWKNDKFIRTRNQLIVELLLACGPRRGGLLGMQVGDLDPLTGRLTVLRRKDALDNPRPLETGNKHGDYRMVLGYRVLQIFKAYQIQRHKVLTHKKCRTPYVFLSIDGRPLEQSSLNYIIRSLRAIPELADIHPHLLRHTWASNFVEDGVARGVDLDAIERDLRTLGGWSKLSQMPSYYTSRYRDEKSFESSRRLQAKAAPMTKKIHNKEPS